MSEKANKSDIGIGEGKIREQMQNIDDETFRKTIIQTAKALGLSDKRAEKLASDVPGLKNKLASISDRDFNKMLGSLPPEKAAEIFEMLNKKS